MEKMTNVEAGNEGKIDNRDLSLRTSKTHNIEKMLRKLSEEEKERNEVDREVGARFLAWFRSWANEFRGIIRERGFRDPRQLRKMEFVLGQMEHHFIDSHACQELRNAFRYLRLYLKAYPCVSPKHARKAVEMLGRIVASRRTDYEVAGGEVRAWFGNRIWVIFRTIENPKFKEPHQMMEIAFFLEIIEGYFIDAGSSRHFRSAFHYLRRYLSVYPLVRKRQSEKAIEMIARIHQGLGYKFEYEAHVKPGLLDEEPGCGATYVTSPALVPVLRVA